MLLILLFPIVSVDAQEAEQNTFRYYNNQRDTFLYLSSDSIVLDTLSLVPESIIVDGLSADCYSIDPYSAVLKFHGSCDRPDSLRVRYRVFPFSFQKKASLSKFSYDSLRVFRSYTNTEQADLKSLQFKSLDYTGAYSRSMNVGNNQSLSLNSNFNMQVSGYLVDSIRIEGAIMDNQVPFQPDGNTQRIQEFDRLYLIFEKKKHKLTIGDYNLEKPDSYFLQFNKRVQGLFYQGTSLGTGEVKNTVGFSGSIAKGQFARNIFNGIEGNQGPYKLTGNNGEQFFILLAGTEKVYIDGFLLERGEDRDYIINYNTGEIIFMPRVLITKDKRIQVEFEYQDRNYLNSLFYAYDHLQINDRLSLHFNAYSNQDAKNQPYLQDINEDQRRFLYNLGDDIEHAYYNTASEESFAANKILYDQKDTVVDGITYHDIYEYSPDSTLAKYGLSFSYVGEQKGNYVISGENTNGRSYQWVAPQDGVSQGAYEPVVLLVTPKLHQVFTAGGQYEIDSTKSIIFEGSMSNYDPNLFSKIGNDEHLGFAGKFSYNDKRYFGRKDSTDSRKNSWQNLLSYEYVQSRYKVIAPYRNVEFFRDWNVISEDSVQANEHILSYQTTFARENLGNVQYEFSYFNREDLYQAQKNKFSANYIRNHTKTGFILNIMNSQSIHMASRFWRPSVYAEQEFPRWSNLVVGAKYEQEHNEIYVGNSDVLRNDAFSFDVYNAYIRGGKSDDLTYGIQYRVRKDRLARDAAFREKNMGQNIDINLTVHRWENHQLDFTGGYRDLVAYDSAYITTEVPGQTIIGRLNYTGNVKNGFFTPTLLYEFGSGQEQKRSYTYVEVPPGQGIYYWVDYNGDGVQQANEFEIGIYPDQKKFIRIITPNNEYVKVNFYKLNASFTLNGAQLFDQEKRDRNIITKIISRISNQFSLELNNRVLSEAGLWAYVPFRTQFEDTQIIQYNQALINTFFFNRSGSKWGMEFITNYNGMKTLLTFGLESSRWMRQTLQLRAAFNKSLSTIVKFKSGYRSYYSGVNDGRTYHFDFNAVNPTLTLFMGTRVRITGSYEYDQRINKRDLGGEQATIHSAGIDTRFSFKTLGSLQFGGTLSIIGFNGDENSGVGIAMLDALKIGNNFLWNLQWNTKVSKGIELSLQYDGRKPGDTKIIHTASMSLRAIL